jgi:hypothetical protein
VTFDLANDGGHDLARIAQTVADRFDDAGEKHSRKAIMSAGIRLPHIH